MEEEFEKFLVNENVSPELFYETRDFFKMYVIDEEARTKINNRDFSHFAGDPVMTYILKKIGPEKLKEIPEYINYDIRFDGMSAEAIYATLENEIDEDKHTPEQISHISFENQYELEIDDEESLIDMSEQLLNKAKLQGDLPLGIEIFVPNLFESKISWEDELYQVIEQSVKFDYRLFPTNKRYLSSGVALPALSGSKAKIVIAIDSSGSIDGSLLSRFLSEVESIMNTFTNFQIDLLIADAKVLEHHILYAGDELSYNIKGGGGTNFENTFI